MAGFEGDRGKDRLGGSNVRELVPFFIEQDGQQVVNEELKIQPGESNKGGKGSNKKKGGAKAANVDNQAAAAANKATAVRPFAAVQKGAAKTVASNSSAAKIGKWAGGAFLNSPPPSSLPMPKIPGGGPPLTDPAIVASSQPAAPQFAPGMRVVAMFLDGEWYDGTITEVLPSKCMIIFDGYEDEGGYEIDGANIRPPQQQPPQPHPHMPPPLGQPAPLPHMHYSPVLAPGHNPNAPPGFPIQIGQQADAVPTTGGSTSLADLERQLLSSASLNDPRGPPLPQQPLPFPPHAQAPPAHPSMPHPAPSPQAPSLPPPGLHPPPAPGQLLQPQALLSPQALLAPAAAPPNPQPSVRALPARKPHSSLLASALNT